MSRKKLILQPSRSLVEPSVFERNAMANMKIDAAYFKGEDGEFHLLGEAEKGSETGGEKMFDNVTADLDAAIRSASKKTAPPHPPTTGSNAVKPKTGSVVNTDFLFTALQQQVENNTKLVQIVVDLTHRLEQSAVMIDGLNHIIISLAKGETST